MRNLLSSYLSLVSSFPKQPLPVFPLYCPNLRHTGTGADRKTGKTTPSPRTATPSDGRVARIASQKRRSSIVYNPSSTHLSFSSTVPRKHSPEYGRSTSVFKPPARLTASSMSSTCNRDSHLSILRDIPPRRGVSLFFFGKNRDAFSSSGGGVRVSVVSAQANRVHIAQ